MADHLVTGLLEVQVTCGNLSCGRTWRQPGLDPMERIGWIVCPHCCTAAPVNVRDDLGTRPVEYDEIRYFDGHRDFIQRERSA